MTKLINTQKHSIRTKPIDST